MKRSKHSLSNTKLLTCDMGRLIPVNCFEALPGDTIQQSTSALIRVSPLLSPVMHPVKVRLHHFFVPNRLIWTDFPDFITGGPDGDDTTSPPIFSRSAIAEGSLHDYLDVPVEAAYSPNLEFSALFVRAYDLIYNEWYRDQDLCTELTIDKGNGTDATTDDDVQHVSWEKGYLSTARPWEQKGTGVTIPLGSDAPVTGLGMTTQDYSGGSPVDIYETDGIAARTIADNREFNTNVIRLEEDPSNNGYPNLRADLAAATGISINDLRLALAVQRYQERGAKFGTRYVEYLRSLGVRSSDARLQNPEFLGGGSQILQFSEVLSTDGANTGEMKGHGITALRSNKYRRFFEEHGIVMTLLSVIPKAIYTQGLARKYSRTVKEDYFQKELQNIGEQEVLNKEVYTNHTTPEGVFGYQQRYDEYRHSDSGKNIAGEFHSTMDHWHYGRIFTGDPALNQSFIDAVPTKRVNASNNTDCLYVEARNSIQARRMVSKFARSKTF